MSSVSFQDKTFFSVSYDRSLNDHNQTLWVAIVNQAIKDIEDLLIYSTRSQKVHGLADIDFKHEIDRTLYELSNPWFQVVCLEADVDSQRVLKVIDKILFTYKYADISYGRVPKRQKVQGKKKKKLNNARP